MAYPDSINQMDEPLETRPLPPGSNHLKPQNNPTTDEAVETPDALKEKELTPHAKAVFSSSGMPHRTITWVRANDLLTHGTGQLAGHGIAASHALNRVPRRAVGLGGRPSLDRSASDSNPADRRSRLAPLSAFGVRRERPNRPGLTR